LSRGLRALSRGLRHPQRQQSGATRWSFGISATFSERRAKRSALLWRGSCDGFSAVKFHRGDDGRANTLTLTSGILTFSAEFSFRRSKKSLLLHPSEIASPLSVTLGKMPD
jgi:hypothetical protein